MGQVLMNILGLLAGGAGCLILVGATGAIHEIEAFILFLTATVFFVGGGIVRALDRPIVIDVPDKAAGQ